MLIKILKNLFNYNEPLILQLHLTISVIIWISTLGMLSLEVKNLKGLTLIERAIEVPYISSFASFGMLIILGVLLHLVKEGIINYRATGNVNGSDS
tara:strand:- start:1958 stop:2245 length:288 start_codon:yes stop_codon:yes gene_type:complete